MIDIVDSTLKESTAQHQEDILVAHKGWFKFSPHIGVGIIDYMDDDRSKVALSDTIRRNFTFDDIQVNQVQITDKIKINAHYQSPT